MVVELDVEVGEAVRHVRDADDGRAVDECAGLHEHAVEEQRVIRRDEEVAVRQPATEGAGRDADRQRAQRVGKDGDDGLHADPAHRGDAAVGRQHEVRRSPGPRPRGSPPASAIAVPGRKQTVKGVVSIMRSA